MVTQLTPADFWGRVDRAAGDGCWLWTGALTESGYGRLRYGGRMVRAHRLAYELTVGPIPEGLELDHLCRTRACVRADHLEPVTHQENVRRGSLWAVNGSKTRCPAGHEYSEANTYRSDGDKRHCRTCRRVREAQRRERLRAGVAA